MDPTRGMLYERHHANTLHPDVLIVESASGLGENRMQISNGEDDSGESLLGIPKMSNSSIIASDDPDARGANLHREDDLLPPPDVESALNSIPPRPLLHGVRSWDEIHQRFGGLPDDLDTLDIMRESSRMLRRQTDILTSLAAALILPMSIIVLTHVVITRPVINWAQTHLEFALFEEFPAAGIRTAVTKFIAEFIVASVIDIPLAISLAALSKAGTIYIVASTYAGLKVSFADLIHRVVPRVWIPLVITYFSSLAVFIGVGVTALLLVGVANGLFAALNAPSALILLVFTILGLTVCGVFVYLKIILNVANVICVLEDKYGFAALARSFSILQPRIQVALGSYVVAFLCAGFFTLLFEYRVTDKNYYTEHNASATWEAPLLILLHSSVYMFADIMTTVLYFTCPYKSSCYEALDAPRVPEVVGSVL